MCQVDTPEVAFSRSFQQRFKLHHFLMCHVIFNQLLDSLKENSDHFDSFYHFYKTLFQFTEDTKDMFELNNRDTRINDKKVITKKVNFELRKNF